MMELFENERIDELHRKGYQIIQNTKMFCFGIDAVILSAFADVRAKDQVLDMGSGNGIIPLMIHAKYEPSNIIGLEIQEANVRMARRSILLNNLESDIQMMHGDIKEAAGLLPLSSFDVVTCNPPYMDSGSGLHNELSAKTIARHEVLCSLEDVITSASRLTRVGGRFYLVHRPHRLVQIISLLRQYNMEPKRLRMVHPTTDAEATMVLIESVRGGKPFLKVEKPLIVYEEGTQYTEEVRKLYYE